MYTCSSSYSHFVFFFQLKEKDSLFFLRSALLTSGDKLFQSLMRNAEIKVYVLLLPEVEYIMTVICFWLLKLCLQCKETQKYCEGNQRISVSYWVLCASVMFHSALSLLCVRHLPLQGSKNLGTDVGSALQIQGQQCHPLPHPEGDNW